VGKQARPRGLLVREAAKVATEKNKGCSSKPARGDQPSSENKEEGGAGHTTKMDSRGTMPVPNGEVSRNKLAQRLKVRTTSPGGQGFEGVRLISEPPWKRLDI